jgi:hypothetical protein
MQFNGSEEERRQFESIRERLLRLAPLGIRAIGWARDAYGYPRLRVTYEGKQPETVNLDDAYHLWLKSATTDLAVV